MFVCLFDGILRHFQQYFSYIVAVSFISWGNRMNLSEVTDKLHHIMLYTSPWSRFELTTSVVIGTGCIGSCKSNYYTITAMTAPFISWTNCFICLNMCIKTTPKVLKDCRNSPINNIWYVAIFDPHKNDNFVREHPMISK
jgi:hypothetical protein